MNVDRFYTLVEACLGGSCHFGVLAEEEAARTTHVVLHALGPCLAREERLRLAQALPRRLAVELMALTTPADPIERVVLELQLDRDLAVRRVRAVMQALSQAAADAHASLTP
jgi:uncharacterized protein (DUF2267 family)